MLTLTSLARADRHMLLNVGNDVQRWWRLVYTVLTGMVELLQTNRITSALAENMIGSLVSIKLVNVGLSKFI